MLSGEAKRYSSEVQQPTPPSGTVVTTIGSSTSVLSRKGPCCRSLGVKGSSVRIRPSRQHEKRPSTGVKPWSTASNSYWGSRTFLIYGA